MNSDTFLSSLLDTGRTWSLWLLSTKIRWLSPACRIASSCRGSYLFRFFQDWGSRSRLTLSGWQLWRRRLRCLRIHRVEEIINYLQPPINDILTGQPSIFENQLFQLNAFSDENVCRVFSFAWLDENLHIVPLQVLHARFHWFLIWGRHYQEVIVLIANLRRLIVHFLSTFWITLIFIF